MPPVKEENLCLKQKFWLGVTRNFFLNGRLEAIILYLAVKAGMQDPYISGSATYSTE